MESIQLLQVGRLLSAVVVVLVLPKMHKMAAALVVDPLMEQLPLVQLAKATMAELVEIFLQAQAVAELEPLVVITQVEILEQAVMAEQEQILTLHGQQLQAQV
jgi:hypothetical protein